MSNFVYRTTTNTTADSKYDVLGHHMPARIFFFVTVEEVGKDGMLVRRTYSTINDPYLKQLELSPLGEMREVYPEKYGLWSKGGPKAPGSVVEHVLEYDKLTSYASPSRTYPEGAGRMAGKTVYVDIAKARRAGARLVTTDEIVRAIDEYAAKARSKDRRWAEHIKQKVLAMDKEVLVQPRPMVPGEGVFSQRGLAISLGIVKYARGVRVVGLAFTGYDLSVASNESIRLKSIRPLEKEVIRQAGGWAGSWAGAVAGARVGATAGAMVGIELGPGAVITGAIGGIVFGAIGYFGGSMIAGQIPDK
ncbi:glycine zipper family protein [Burkholderia cenocepacia]|uniref:glycine zipper family protein n=1 Tax=Burkholderia cenocepacia TaxID=95486 RepID=UPI00383F1E94